LKKPITQLTEGKLEYWARVAALAQELEDSADVENERYRVKLVDPRNVLLMADGGGILFCQIEPGIYEVHQAHLKPKRNSKGGPHIRNVNVDSYRWMFTHTDCMVLLTRIPAFNRAAIIFAPLLGWRLEFERKSVWPTKDGMPATERME
jgi:hypothetical protein